MRIFLKFLNTAIFSFFLIVVAYSQDFHGSNCSENLDINIIKFQEGNINDIIDREKNSDFFECLNNGSFTNEESIKARELLLKSYIFLEDKVEAEQAMKNLLKIDKEHLLGAKDPSELHNYFANFRVKPIFRVAFRAGISKSIVNVIQPFTTSSTSQPKKYNEQINISQLGLSYNLELSLEKEIFRNFHLCLGPQYQSLTYFIQGDIIPNSMSYVLQNRSHWFKVPLLLKYDFDFRKDKSARYRSVPYILAGASLDYIIRSRYFNASRTGGIAYTLPTFEGNLLEFNQTNRSNLSFIVGLGLKMRVRNVNFFTIEGKFNTTAYNLFNPKYRYANRSVHQDIGFVEDDIFLDSFSLSVGYTFSVYKPKFIGQKEKK